MRWRWHSARTRVRPGDEVDIDVQTQGEARIGLVAVDRSVYILAENRLNLQQVFNELERLYQLPQVELHEARPIFDAYTRGAKDTFEDAGVIVMTNQNVPEGKEYRQPRPTAMPMAVMLAAAKVVVEKEVTQVEALDGDTKSAGDLAAVQRVRQFFPETWLWIDLFTDQSGHGTVGVTAPDSITTWQLEGRGNLKGTWSGHLRGGVDGIPGVLPPGGPPLLGDQGRGVARTGGALQLPRHPAGDLRRPRTDCRFRSPG